MIKALAYIGGAIAIGGILWGALLLWGAYRAWRSVGVAIAGPTDAEAKIEAQTKKTAGEIAAEAEKKAKEIIGADKKTTLASGRSKLWPRSMRKP